MVNPAVLGAPTAFGEVDMSHPDPDGGTRRAYNSSNNPDYIDDFGWTMPSNPNPGWKLQIYVSCGTFECNTGLGHSRTYKVYIGGTFTGVQAAVGGPPDSSNQWVTIPNLSGAVQFYDNVDGGSETDHTGIVTFKYRYARV